MFGTNLFGIGMPELIFIAIIALIVLGPQRLPGMLRELAKFIAQLRGMVSELTSQFSEEIAMIEELDPRKLIDEVTQPINELTKPFPDKKPVPDKKPASEKKPETSKAAEATASSITTAQKPAETSVSKSSDSESSTGELSTKPSSPAELDDIITEKEKEESSAVYGGEASRNDAGNDDVGNGDAGNDDVGNDDEKKGPQPQFQTDASNVASTEPYKNRTPNLNVIKRPSKDAKEDAVVDIDPAEENQIAPPAMQENLAEEKLAKEQAEQDSTPKAAKAGSKIADGSTATQLLSGKAVNGNGKNSDGSGLNETKMSDPNVSDSDSDKVVES